MSDDDPPQIRCTPTDPSIEFDLFEVVRLRLVEALIAGGYSLIEAERVALYFIAGARQVSKLLKTLTTTRPPSHEEVLEALSQVLGEVQAMEKARLIMIRSEDPASTYEANPLSSDSRHEAVGRADDKT